MNNDKGLFYLTDPKVRAYIEQEGELLRSLYETRLADPVMIDADSNDRLTAMSHWTALLMALAIQHYSRRSIDAAFIDMPPEDIEAMTGQIFARDTLDRALELVRERRGK